MKKIILSLTLLLSVLAISAQDKWVYSLHIVRVEGNLENFEKVQALYMKKVAKIAADKGDIIFWGLLKTYRLDNIDNEGSNNYAFFQSNPNIYSLLSAKNAWWTNATSVLTTEEQAIVTALQSTFTWTADSRHVFAVEGDVQKGVGHFVQFNFASPDDLGGFIAENNALWKPYFEQHMEKMGMTSWGVSRRIAPLGQRSNGNNWSTFATWDMFNSIEELMQYRISATIPAEMLKKSKMGTYNPAGFSNQPIFEILTTTAN